MGSFSPKTATNKSDTLVQFFVDRLKVNHVLERPDQAWLQNVSLLCLRSLVAENGDLK